MKVVLSSMPLYNSKMMAIRSNSFFLVISNLVISIPLINSFGVDALFTIAALFCVGLLGISINYTFLHSLYFHIMMIITLIMFTFFPMIISLILISIQLFGVFGIAAIFSYIFGILWLLMTVIEVIYVDLDKAEEELKNDNSLRIVGNEIAYISPKATIKAIKQSNIPFKILRENMLLLAVGWGLIVSPLGKIWLYTNLKNISLTDLLMACYLIFPMLLLITRQGLAGMFVCYRVARRLERS